MILVSYDIASDRIRRKVANQLLNYGKRVQYSVFECDISRKQYRQLYKELVELTSEMKEGNIRFYHIPENADQTAVIGDPSYVTGNRKEDVIFI